MSVTIKKIDRESAPDLARILSLDKRLSAALERKHRKINSEKCYQDIDQWQNKTNSKTYAIRLNGRAIGTISLSRINLIEKRAGVGYWISSRHWNKGYGTLAVHLLIKRARRMGLEKLTAKVKLENEASIKIWDKLGAKSRKTKRHLLFELVLKTVKVEPSQKS